MQHIVINLPCVNIWCELFQLQLTRYKFWSNCWLLFFICSLWITCRLLSWPMYFSLHWIIYTGFIIYIHYIHQCWGIQIGATYNFNFILSFTQNSQSDRECFAKWTQWFVHVRWKGVKEISPTWIIGLLY
jgi:hypothetical protein